MYVDIRMLIYASVCSYHRSYHAPLMQIRSTNTLSKYRAAISAIVGQRLRRGVKRQRVRQLSTSKQDGPWNVRSLIENLVIHIDTGFFLLLEPKSSCSCSICGRFWKTKSSNQTKKGAASSSLVIMIMIQKVTENKPIGRRLCPVNGQHGRSSPSISWKFSPSWGPQGWKWTYGNHQAHALLHLLASSEPMATVSLITYLSATEKP